MIIKSIFKHFSFCFVIDKANINLSKITHVHIIIWRLKIYGMIYIIFYRANGWEYAAFIYSLLNLILKIIFHKLHFIITSNIQKCQ